MISVCSDNIPVRLPDVKQVNKMKIDRKNRKKSTEINEKKIFGKMSVKKRVKKK
jgi:hypothetical protein